MGRFKNIWGSNMYYYITTLSLFHFFLFFFFMYIIFYFISLETAKTQKSGNVNGSVFNFQYSQIYNFSCRKEFLETICKCIYLGF